MRVLAGDLTAVSFSCVGWKRMKARKYLSASEKLGLLFLALLLLLAGVAGLYFGVNYRD
jgi:hypothetical protein